MTAATTAIDLMSLRANIGRPPFNGATKLGAVPPACPEAHSVTSVTRRSGPGTLVPDRLRPPTDWRMDLHAVLPLCAIRIRARASSTANPSGRTASAMYAATRTPNVSTAASATLCLILVGFVLRAKVQTANLQDRAAVPLLSEGADG